MCVRSVSSNIFYEAACCYNMSMARISAGILMYRKHNELQVFLVHPGGPVWAKKDLGSWSIPKGEIDPEEDPLSAAKREFEEETGFKVSGSFIWLSPVKLKSGKTVKAWAVEGDCDPEAIRSNTFRIEWPPKSGRYQEFPEVDRAAWLDLAQAKEKINKGHVPLIEELECILKIPYDRD
ncbi:NUDIX hydrolase [Candidatus Sulfobium mesophilum]|uniref:NUDIX hydrolase n=1 Tax=Candidatus Sulfobium mesophilum TaxID=2016548 RepID=A0A2U3QHM2_9BACT|nr:NUDIX hydrolase [Candidatus Sulfobium mesophilum]